MDATKQRMPWEPDPEWKWIVRYYDPKKKGIWSMKFSDLTKAEEFASTHRIYAKPCKVEEI